MGTLSGAPAHPVSDPVVRAQESCGLFIAGDASVLRHYSGTEPGSRWLFSADGALIDQLPDWPAARGAQLLATEQEARALYGHLRAHALAARPALVPQDTRHTFALKAEGAHAESFWLDQQDVLRLFFDRVSDQQAMHLLTDRVATFPSGHDDSPLMTYATVSARLYLAVARGPSGAADHVALVHSEDAKPEPTITGGLSGAVRHLQRGGIQLPTGILVVQWGRFSGSDVLRYADAAAPETWLRPQLSSTVTAPIKIGNVAAGRLGAPGAYAVRMEPGTYELAHYELSTARYGRFTCCAVSREGAPSFTPSAQAAPTTTPEPAPVVQLPASDVSLIERTALEMIALAPDQVPSNLLAAVERIAASVPAKAVLDRALRILQAAGRQNTPKFDAIPKRVEPLARAHWLAMDAAERTRHGKEADYANQQLEAICKANGVSVPSLGNVLGGVGRFFRKL